MRMATTKNQASRDGGRSFVAVASAGSRRKPLTIRAVASLGMKKTQHGE